jgi:soluble lytic murein transglycosylase-like protein
MTFRSWIAVGVLVAGAGLLSASSARAQITSYVDSSGKTIYVNGDSPEPRRGSTISSPSAASSALPSPSDLANGSALARPSDRLDKIVQEAASRHQMDPALIKAVISTESGWNPLAISRKGAVGLMQLEPGTAQRFGVSNPFDPVQNVEGGTTYLKTLLDRYNGDLSKSLAAYNAGEHAVDQSGGIPAYPETRHYVQKVTNAYFRPGSGRTSTQWAPPPRPVRREQEPDGQVVFTNE